MTTPGNDPAASGGSGSSSPGGDPASSASGPGGSVPSGASEGGSGPTAPASGGDAPAGPKAGDTTLLPPVMPQLDLDAGKADPTKTVAVEKPKDEAGAGEGLTSAGSGSDDKDKKKEDDMSGDETGKDDEGKDEDDKGDESGSSGDEHSDKGGGAGEGSGKSGSGDESTGGSGGGKPPEGPSGDKAGDDDNGESEEDKAVAQITAIVTGVIQDVKAAKPGQLVRANLAVGNVKGLLAMCRSKDKLIRLLKMAIKTGGQVSLDNLRGVLLELARLIEEHIEQLGGVLHDPVLDEADAYLKAQKPDGDVDI